MNDVPDDSVETRIPRQDLENLPLGYRTVWEKPLLSREELRTITLRNTRWWSKGVARSSEKPISKIVSLPEGRGHGPDSAPQ